MGYVRNSANGTIQFGNFAIGRQLVPLIPLVTIDSKSVSAANGANGSIGRTNGTNGTIGRANGVSGTIGKNDRSMNDVQDTLLTDTCWNVVSVIWKLYVFSLKFAFNITCFSPRLNSSNFDAILNDVIFPIQYKMQFDAFTYGSRING